MAEPVYDEDKELDSLSPQELRDREQEYSNPVDEAEDNAVEDGAAPDTMPRGSVGRKLRKRSELKDSEEQEALNKRVSGSWDKTKTADRENGGGKDQSGWYKGNKAGNPKNKGLLGRWGKSRRTAIIAGASGSAIAGIALVSFGFLNFYKLDGLISNIDEQSFARVNGSLDQRSSKYISAYMRLRLADIGDDPKNIDTDNILFRSNKVDTNSPISDWYKTLRTSKFEEDVFNKHGIKFASFAYREGSQIKFRPARIKVKDKIIVGNSLPDDIQAGIRNAVATGDWNSFNDDKLMAWINTDIDIYSNDKEARREIKTVVNDNTRFYQVVQRRQVRKAIQNMTGVRDWRFFEDTRNKLDEKKINVRNKIVEKSIPESTKSGKFVRCLFGITDCKFSEDTSDPENQAASDLIGNDNPDKEGDPVNQTDPHAPKEVVDMGPAADVIKKVISNTAPVLQELNVVSTLDSLSRIDTAVSNNELSKSVSVARGTQAMSLYQGMKTARDQAKTGELQGAEYNQLMQVLGPVAASEGWTKVVDNQGDASKLTDTQESRKYCSKENQADIENNPTKANKQFANLCGGKQIGGGSNAQTLEDSYKNSIGAVLHPIVGVYKQIRNTPIIGTALDLANAIIGQVTGVLTNALQGILKLVGVDDDLQSMMLWLTQKIVAFLGAGPILNGNESAGVLFNWMVQGGAYTAEATARFLGGAVTTAASKVSAEQNTAQYIADQNASMSTYDKYLSLSNPDSPAAKGAIAVTQINIQSVINGISNFGTLFRIIGSPINTLLSGHAGAATDKPYNAANFAGIKSIDQDPSCYGLDPITMAPKDATNVQEVLVPLGIDVPDSDITWDLLRDNDKWYAYVYGKLGDRSNASEIALTIHNCQLTDNAAMGGLGATHGYTKDGGLNDTPATQATPAPTDTPDASDGTLPTGSSKELASQLLKYLDDKSIGCNGGQGASCPDIRKTASGQSIKNGSCYVDALDPVLLGMLLKLVQTGHKLVLSAVCSDHPSNPTSYHHKGKAADFNFIDGVFMGEGEDSSGSIPWTSQGGAGQKKIDTDKKLLQNITSFVPKSTGFGQIQCHPAFDFLSGFVVFDDGCHHQHVQVP
jgi:hypothetical protein